MPFHYKQTIISFFSCWNVHFYTSIATMLQFDYYPPNLVLFASSSRSSLLPLNNVTYYKSFQINYFHHIDFFQILFCIPSINFAFSSSFDVPHLFSPIFGLANISPQHIIKFLLFIFARAIGFPFVS